ncbi:hypothetical protein DFA_00956 [Cavenderia fasciculata]|uniref:Uncharacterized protein n=1 Tax=Cavenderia fasciculata TaxID=261658 RepID=F4PUR2_CACFS|nr:uncharacterized protein DFA_00956 [Cavenderia fasciculata]EGG21081.1 hypothetical protein DFA_00956 [Cavenderia fasciculata]|eukprot:XP_004358931.1 hypothetical protein DFA_00956 [Cavenderia fasciculata]
MGEKIRNLPPSKNNGKPSITSGPKPMTSTSTKTDSSSSRQSFFDP